MCSLLSTSSLYNAAFIVVFLLNHLTSSTTLVAAYSSSRLHDTPQQPSSGLASKVIYQSPPIDNIYKELLVASKPLYLRKYNSGPKVKKTKKDSKIYYIPIPPLPYRYIPGVGYDYQPMKINPIMMEQQPTQASLVDINDMQDFQLQTQLTTTVKPMRSESKIYNLQYRNYYFNGRPFRLQVARARGKHQLTAQNLKSNFYFDKPIIY